ncbi:MAG: DUF86 domain-containing protein [Bacillus sp. (in: firmicutes)]
MYFVDRHKIEENLTFLEKNIQLYEEMKQWDSEYDKLTLERLTHVMLDCVLDTCNAMIDGFIMRDPGSYEDIIDIMLDEKVITEDLEKQFKRLLPLRKMIVQDYVAIDHQEIQSVLNENMQALKEFPQTVRQYITNELGPVSAFKN